MHKKHSWLITLLMVLFVLLAACSSNETPSPEEPTATEVPAATEGPTATEESEVTEGSEVTESSEVTEESGAAEESTAAEEPAAPEESTAAEEPPATETSSDELEIWSWWIDPGEVKALNAMTSRFEEQNLKNVRLRPEPDERSEYKRLLNIVMQANDSVDSFQVHAGPELIYWVEAEKMEPITTLIFEERSEWWDHYPEELIELFDHRGEIWGVPVNVHRSNVLWYNKKVFDDHGLTPPTTFKEFDRVAKTLQDAGITPLALGDNDPWAATHLFESVLLGIMGPDGYEGLWKRNADWDGTEVKEALDKFAEMMAYVNEDHKELTWKQAAQRVADGRAAMTIMGDWTHGYFIEQGLKPNEEYGWVPSPGTDEADEVFMMLSDSFGLPKGAPNRENAIAWLKFVSSKEAQDIFNPPKGSIPAHRDSHLNPDPELYDLYQLSAMDDFVSNRIVPSLAHGAAASEEWFNEINEVMRFFVETDVADPEKTKTNIETAQRELKQACQRVGNCNQGQGSLSGELEIFSWWTAGGELDALNAIEEEFENQNPNVIIIDATVKDRPSAQAVLARHMEEGDSYDPYDSFLVHAGRELIDTWVVADKMEPLDRYVDKNDWEKNYPEGVRNILTYDNQIWSVPVNVHRSNVLWYNKKVFDENGLTPPTTFDEFFDVAKTLEEAGVTPLALGDEDPWAATHLFESVLLGTMGVETYRDLWNGSTVWGGDKVREALENFNGMIEYVNPNHAQLSWDEAAQLVADGNAAMTIMGDWTHGYFLDKGLKLDEEYGWVPSPGIEGSTEGSFMMLADSFGLPKGAPNRENTIAWLKLVGSKEGQDIFNPIKGSIPARTDADREKYDDYQKAAMDDFASDEIVPSLAHGAAASEQWLEEINKVMASFVIERNIGTAQTKLEQVCKDVGKCQ